MSFLFGSSDTQYIPTLSPEQNADIAAKTKLFTSVIGPQYEQFFKGAGNLYNQSAQGQNAAAQNLANIAAKAQTTLGGTGESALRTGIYGLQSAFDPEYEARQMQAAMMPAQAQYSQNLANQRAAFGATGNMGSARQALADRQLAGATQSAQMQAAAQVQRDLQAGRLGAASQLAGLGQGGLGQAIGAAQQGVNASTLPMNLYAQYGQTLGLTPPGTYTPNFQGTQGYNKSDSNFSFGFGGNNMPKF
jgi:hypothetical protein